MNNTEVICSFNMNVSPSRQGTKPHGTRKSRSVPASLPPYMIPKALHGKSYRRAMTGLILALVSALILVACGGGSTAGDGGGTATGSVPAGGGITHNGFTYGTLTSPATGKIWLDRNLGASQVCTAVDDEKCFGDHYQWGRNTDGHEKNRKAAGNSHQTIVPGGNEGWATSYTNVGHGFYIRDPEWLQLAIDPTGEKRAAQWSKTDGTSVCPVGYRVPTKAEIEAEVTAAGITSKLKAYESFLKIPFAGAGIVVDFFTNLSVLWSTTQNNERKAWGMGFDQTNTISDFIIFGDALSVRCIKG